MRPGHREVGAADGRHADEVVGAAEERGEGGGERLPSAHLHPDRHGDHLLLGDVGLEEPIRHRGLGEQLGVRAVADLAVDRHDLATRPAERHERVAERLARRLLRARLVRGSVSRSVGNSCGRPSMVGFATSTWMSRMPPSSAIDASAIVERLPVLARLVRDRLDAVPLLGPRDDRGRLPGRLDRAAAYARSMAATSCPSISIAFQPNASTRRRYASRSQPCIVSPVWPSRLTSMIAVRLSRPLWPAASKASHIEPSAISESPHRHQTRYGSRSSRLPASATPTLIGRPWPSEPVATSTQGSTGVG